jgi:hypothetical protein
MFEGKKTYITAAIGVIVTGALAMGYINQTQYDLIVGVLASLGLAFLRAGVTKSGPNL